MAGNQQLSGSFIIRTNQWLSEQDEYPFRKHNISYISVPIFSLSRNQSAPESDKCPSLD